MEILKVSSNEPPADFQRSLKIFLGFPPGELLMALNKVNNFHFKTTARKTTTTVINGCKTR